MASVMASLDDYLKKDMEHFSWVNWSEVAREAFVKKAKRLEALDRFNKLLENSEFTEGDALELSRKAKEGRFKELKEQGLI